MIITPSFKMLTMLIKHNRIIKLKHKVSSQITSPTVEHVSKLFSDKRCDGRIDSPPSHGVSSGLQSKVDKKAEIAYPSILKTKWEIKQSDYILYIKSMMDLYPISFQLTQI